MTAPQPIQPGTAEQLARLAHFRALEHVQPEELDFIALHLLGDVGDSQTKWALWDHLRDDAAALFDLITDDYDDDDLDDLDDDDLEHLGLPTGSDAIAARYDRTRDRIVLQIEESIRLARYRRWEQ